MRKSSYTSNEHFGHNHRFEHWYRDNTVYFITSRCRDKFPAFASTAAQEIFWDRFEYYAQLHGYIPWITTLMNNHYHSLGYLKLGSQLGPMMRKFHGSVAKLVNDVLPERHLPFWRSSGNQDYFDGCIRDENQCRRAYRYTLLQSVRAGLCRDYREYPDTRMRIKLDVGLRRLAIELKTFLPTVPYKRYER